MTDIEKIKQLREQTSVSLGQCKKALEESDGDLEKAKELLRKWGEDVANKKSGRLAKQGIIEAYIHSNKKVGAMVELRCETDFVAKNKDFQELAHNLAMQITAMKPLYVKPEDVPRQVLEKEKEIYKAQLADSNKPKELLDKILEGKLNKYKNEVSLLTQPFVKDPTRKVKDIINEYISVLGENIVVERFARFEI